MAQEEPNRFVEWYLLIRRQGPVVRRHLNAWLDAVREEPTLIWQTPAVRYTVYGTAAVVLMYLFLSIPTYFGSASPGQARPQATKADFHVVCSDRECSYHFVINRDFGYRKFPVQCPKCAQRTGAQARQCGSKSCQRRWVAPEQRDDRLYCPRCGERLD